MVRILYYYGGPHLDTGSPRALVALVDILDRTRMYPLFLATGSGPLVDALEARGVEIRRGKVANVSYRNPLAGLRGVLKHARCLREWKIDLVHLNEFGWNLDLVFGAWLARVPVLLHVHLPGEVAWQNLHRFIARQVLFVSHAQMRAIGHVHRVQKKADVLYNLVDLDRFACGSTIRRALGLDNETTVVGTVAQLRYGKGIDTLLETASALLPEFPQLVFAVVGPLGHGEESFGRAMIEAARHPRFEGRVRFLGSRTDIPDVLASFDIFFLPTRKETFGIAVLEALASGLPVVAGDVGGVSEIVCSPELGTLVPPGDVQACIVGLRRLLLDPDMAQVMGDRARHSLHGRFDGETIAAKIHGLYARVLANR